MPLDHPYRSVADLLFAAGFSTRYSDPFDTGHDLPEEVRYLTTYEALHLKPLVMQYVAPPFSYHPDSPYRRFRKKLCGNGAIRLDLSTAFIYRDPKVGPRRTLDELEIDQLKDRTP